MKIAVHQMCSGIDPAKNLQDMLRAIDESAKQQAGFYFAPEMALILDRDRHRAATHIVAETEYPHILALQAAAKEARIWLHIGSLPVVADDGGGKFANRSLIINDQGEIAARYDKIHLFDVQLADGENWQESRQYVPGKHPALVQTPLGKMGLTICYDLRFPSLFGALALAGAEILAVPAAFTVPTGKAHWHGLIRTRAIESAAFVVAAAQSGSHKDGRKTFGHSLVVDPWGEILLDMGEVEGLGFAEIDLARIAEVRGQIPVHLNRRDIGEVKRF
ncbi:MAG: carbon-nitrogen hydrolase family protein [Sphingorhabdus sp.]